MTGGRFLNRSVYPSLRMKLRIVCEINQGFVSGARPIFLQAWPGRLVVAGHDKEGFVFEIPVVGAEAAGVIMLLDIYPFLAGGDFL